MIQIIQPPTVGEGPWAKDGKLVLSDIISPNDHGWVGLRSTAIGGFLGSSGDCRIGGNEWKSLRWLLLQPPGPQFSEGVYLTWAGWRWRESSEWPCGGPSRWCYLLGTYFDYADQIFFPEFYPEAPVYNPNTKPAIPELIRGKVYCPRRGRDIFGSPRLCIYEDEPTGGISAVRIRRVSGHRESRLSAVRLISGGYDLVWGGAPGVMISASGYAMWGATSGLQGMPSRGFGFFPEMSVDSITSTYWSYIEENAAPGITSTSEGVPGFRREIYGAPGSWIAYTFDRPVTAIDRVELFAYSESGTEDYLSGRVIETSTNPLAAFVNDAEAGWTTRATIGSATINAWNVFGF